METKRGVMGIIFGNAGGKRHFLILHRSLNWKGWEFPKGGVEEGEAPEEAVAREISEETGLKGIRIIKRLGEKLEWTSERNYSYDVFLVEGSMEEKVLLGEDGGEHDAFEWLEQSEVLNKLTYNENKEIFRKALKGMVEQ